MSDICFQTSGKGGLLHFPYIFCKPEPLREEFNYVACSVTGPLYSYIFIGKE